MSKESPIAKDQRDGTSLTHGKLARVGWQFAWSLRPWTLVFAAATLLAPLAAPACSLPVFRYALDRWPADNFRFEVSAADARTEPVARFLRNFGTDSALNLEVIRLPATASTPSRLLRPHADETVAPAIWSGALDSASIATLTNSPARQDIVRRLLAGDSVVWILVESGDRAADDAAARTLEKRLRYLEQVAQIPAIDPTDPTSQLGPGPRLAVKFSVLRIPTAESFGVPPSGGLRDAKPPEGGTPNSEPGAAAASLSPPRGEGQGEGFVSSNESIFLRMLAGPKSGLADSREPWFAAVFGRGRVLGAWPAAGFGDEQVEEVCLFLLGACSCQVKQLNPGWDLLLHADWDEQLHAMGFPPAESTTAARLDRNSSLAPETVSITGSEPRGAASVNRREAFLLGGGALLLVSLGGLAWRKFTQKT